VYADRLERPKAKCGSGGQDLDPSSFLPLHSGCRKKMEQSLSETSTRTPSPTAAPTLASETATFVSAHSTSEKPVGTTSKGIRFYLLFASICSSIFLSALDLTSVSTALPQIAADFNTSDYSWIASSYTLASTAVIPWSEYSLYFEMYRTII
jgi:hypothetical protein